jgi:hypothetical protein
LSLKTPHTQLRVNLTRLDEKHPCFSSFNPSGNLQSSSLFMWNKHNNSSSGS